MRKAADGRTKSLLTTLPAIDKAYPGGTVRNPSAGLSRFQKPVRSFCHRFFSSGAGECKTEQRCMVGIASSHIPTICWFSMESKRQRRPADLSADAHRQPKLAKWRAKPDVFL